MRFYNIVVSYPKKPKQPPAVDYTWQRSSTYNPVKDFGTMDVVAKAPSGPIKEWSSYNPDGQFNPNALMVEFDLQTTLMNTPIPGSMVKIYGISLADISEATDLNNMLIEIYGGMGPGLPLANPNQAGLLVKGQIIRAFGNWIGTDQNLCLMIAPSASLAAYQAGGVTFSWQPAQPLGDSIRAALQAGFPDLKIDMSSFDGDAAVVFTEYGCYPNIATFASWLQDVPEYSDIEIHTDNDTIYVSNAKGRAADVANIVQIAPTDLIGQPTWYEPLKIQVTMVMRSDLKIGSIIELPVTMYTSLPLQQGSEGSPSQGLNMGSFQGKFRILSVRHVGNNRSTDAMAWVTIVEGASLDKLP